MLLEAGASDDEHGGDAVRVLVRNTRLVDDLVQARRGVSLVALKELDEHLAREAADGGLVGRQVDEGLGDVLAVEGRGGRLWRVDVGAVLDGQLAVLAHIEDYEL